ncbi:MAG: signal peptide peptidase SppA [Rikenellaceae bacterium]|nr:signal peptide peptidase SppA [Rikenellaceae bacterium]MCL2692657.1 signal peptide peptidase SppA [Rikenellaceae bacterium]
MNFGRTFFAAFLAIVVAGILSVVFFVLIFGGVISSLGGAKPVEVKPGSVLRIDFQRGVADSPPTSPFGRTAMGGLTLNTSNSLLQVLGAIEGAAYDTNIRGIYVNLTGGGVSLANVEEIRAALLRFRDDSGKFVVAYSEQYSQIGYYFSSVADRVFVHPEGGVDWRGLASNVMFYKGLLDKLGIEVEVFRHGSFKSAGEPFVLDRMSRENRLQLAALLESVWQQTLLADIAQARGIAPQTLSMLADNLRLETAEDALEYGFVDAVLYEDQVEALISRLASGGGVGWIDRESERIVQRETGDEEEAGQPYRNGTPQFVGLADYIAALEARGRVGAHKNEIAVIYVDGDIVDGKSREGSVGSATVTEKLAKARRDKNVKGVVVRINSPGGSARASDVMWREMELLRREKPVVVSMGGYAASGGYYVAAPADIILASRSTLTGSIGVFGLALNAGEALRKHTGITTDVVRTNEYADIGSPFRPMRSAERNHIQRAVERVYDTFVGHVAAGRNLSVERVGELAEGRVWTGAQAVENGLVDGIGGLRAAIELCADRAEVGSTYMVKEMVDDSDAFLWSLFRSLMMRVSSSSRDRVALRDEMGNAFVHYKRISEMLADPADVQARMAWEIIIN